MDTPTETKPKRCRSRRKYGPCGLPAGHEPGHAVFIGDDVWFIYGQPDYRVG